MKYLEAVEKVKKVGGGDLLHGMNIIKDMLEPPYFRYDDKAVRAFNIVWKGMNKLFNGDK
jgi:hypothetical protein